MPDMNLEKTNELCQKLENELHKKIIGQKEIIRFLIFVNLSLFQNTMVSVLQPHTPQTSQYLLLKMGLENVPAAHRSPQSAD